MDFLLKEEHILLQTMIRNFTKNEVEPLASYIDEEETFPYETINKMKSLDIFGITVPKKYNGAGGDNLMLSVVIEELAKACATTSLVVSAHTLLGIVPILKFGTEKQKEKYLPKMCDGDWLCAFAITEPNAGTDVSKQQTSAVLDESTNEWVLNGSKVFITNAGVAHIYIVFAMTDKSKGLRGISAFIVDSDSPGFSIGRKEKTSGIRGAAVSDLIFENCRIPKENLLGSIGEGFKIAMITLDSGRIGVASQALGIAQGAFDKTLDYVKVRKQFNRPIAKLQNTQFVLSDMATKIEATRLLVRHAAFRKDNNLTFSKEASMAKLFASETAVAITSKAVQLHGGYGYNRDYPVERMMRDAKVTELYAGTSEAQRIVISTNLLK